MYIVELTGNEKNVEYAERMCGKGYFPRKFHYSIDALNLFDRLKDKQIRCKVSQQITQKRCKLICIYNG